MSRPSFLSWRRAAALAALLFLAGWAWAPHSLAAPADAASASGDHFDGPPPVAGPPPPGGPLDHLAHDPKYPTPPIGFREGDTSGATYYVAHRFKDNFDGGGWGWVKKKGAFWSSAQWIVLKENPGTVAAPYRRLLQRDGDLNWEYKFWGTFAPYQAYDPKTDEMLPVFILTGYEVVGPKDPLSRRPGPPDRGRYHRGSSASSRPGTPIPASF